MTGGTSEAGVTGASLASPPGPASHANLASLASPPGPASRASHEDDLAHDRHDTCRTRSLISWVRPWFQNWLPM